MATFLKAAFLFWMSIFLPSVLWAAPMPTAQSASAAEKENALNKFQRWLTENHSSSSAASSASSQAPTALAKDPAAAVTAPTPEAQATHVTPALPPQVNSHDVPLSYEEGQKAMQQAVPVAANAPLNPESEAAFDALLKQNMPLTPLQVLKLRQQIDTAQRAAAIPANIPPKPVSSTLMINLAPGATPPAVRLAQGYVSSLVFVDSTGEPWPIATYDIGNPKAVSIQWDRKSNILLLQAISPYSDGDIVVRLVGLATPVTLQLVSGQRVVDYRADIHVSGIGPNTKELPLGTNLPNSANQLLLGVLDGVAPPGSRLLTVRGADAQAWLLGEKMYLRIRLTLLSPGWIGKMVSPDGMQAYELSKTSSILVSRYGEPAELKIEGL